MQIAIDCWLNSMFPKQQVPPRSGDDYPPLHGRVIEQLRRAILTGELKAGRRLVEERLAEELGVSRNPVREAIRALASEGLVEVTARRGASVAKMTDQEARETIELRAMLEGHNARLAARRQDRDVIRRIEAVLKKGVQAVSNRRFERLPQLNQEFHHELYAAGQNTVLGEVLDKLRDRTAILFAPGDPAHQARNWEDHAAILRAVIDGDEHRAAGLASEHVMRAGFQYLIGSGANELHNSIMPAAGSAGRRSKRWRGPRHADGHMKRTKQRGA